MAIRHQHLSTYNNAERYMHKKAGSSSGDGASQYSNDIEKLTDGQYSSIEDVPKGVVGYNKGWTSDGEDGTLMLEKYDAMYVYNDTINETGVTINKNATYVVQGYLKNNKNYETFRKTQES